MSFAHPQTPCTVVVVPSFTLDQEVQAKVSGVHHYKLVLKLDINSSALLL